MSKKKSLAWARKTTGHISTGVLNYKNLIMSGRNPARLTPKTYRRRRKEREIRGLADAERQSRETHIDFNLVKLCLDYGNLSLEDAKVKAVALKAHLEGQNA